MLETILDVGAVFLMAICILFVFLAAVRMTIRKKPLEPGDCECGHAHCCHAEGNLGCAVRVNAISCACQIFVPTGGSATAELKELRKMAELDK